MKKFGRRSIAFVVVLSCSAVLLAREGSGRIEGRVTRTDGSALAGVDITIDGISTAVVTDDRGSFEFRRVAAGTYSLSFALLDNRDTRSGVTVQAGSTTTVDQVVDWDVGLVETVTVYSASRRRERIVNAPAAVTTVSEKVIEREASHGEVPRLAEFTPGVYLTQSGLYDFNVSTRGFNSALNRRVAILMDGRDTTDPFLGGPEWATLSLPLDDLAEVELLRGPSAALYGANATTGVLSMTSKQPRHSQGGKLRLAAGEKDAAQIDFRWAGELGRDWYMRVTGSGRRSDYFSVSRLESVEYSDPCQPPAIVTDCLPKDLIPFSKDEIEIVSGGLRFDKYLSGGSLLTFEGGSTGYDGTVFVNPGGTRGQILDTDWPWARFNLSTGHWNVLAYYNDRESESLSLNNPPGSPPFFLDAENARAEVQSNWSFADNRLRLVAGGSYSEEWIESASVHGGKADTDEGAVFAQADWNVNDHVKLVAAARWDDSSLHDSEVSPKGSVVWSVNPAHSLRFTYNEAFQVPTYIEYLLVFPAGPPQPTDGLEAICTGVGVSCGLAGATPILALGNEQLELEQTTTYEIGYSAILSGKAFLTVDLYRSENKDFVTTFVPQVVGTDPLMLVNESYESWRGSSEAEMTAIDPGDCPVPGFGAGQTVADCVRAKALTDYPSMQLTNFDGENIFLGYSLTNFGEVDTQGVDVGLIYYPVEDWKISFGYSWFDFDIEQSAPGLDDLLSANTPENKAFLGLSYVGDRWDASLSGRWVDEFRWGNGMMQGDVESFTTFNLTGNYALNDHVKIGVNAANIFNDEHWESFGGAVIQRRALAHVTYAW